MLRIQADASDRSRQALQIFSPGSDFFGNCRSGCIRRETELSDETTKGKIRSISPHPEHPCSAVERLSMRERRRIGIDSLVDNLDPS
jgi:hypothetical protein